MLKVKGIFDGKRIQLLEELTLLPNTPVKMLIVPEKADAEELYEWCLVELGLLKEARVPTERMPSFRPVPVQGAPVSETIIEERR